MQALPEIHEIEEGLNAAGITVRALCQRAEINQSTWTRWKSGSNAPNTATLAKVSGAYRDLLAEREKTKGAA